MPCINKNCINSQPDGGSSGLCELCNNEYMIRSKEDVSKTMNEYEEIQELVERHYDELFSETIKVCDDDLHDIVIEVKTRDGLTVRKSWYEREEILKQDES